MVYKAVQYLSQGGLPSLGKLALLKTQKVRHLLNISGIDLYQLYSDEQLSDFTLVQFSFKDIFSTGEVLKNPEIEQPNAIIYSEKASEAERLAFFNAVWQLIEWLENRTPSYVFCQQGIGRSPCVVCAALMHCYQPKLEELHKTLKFLNPTAVLTDRSYAAIHWFQQQSPLIHE